MITIKVKSNDTRIPIGRQGEGNVRQVHFNISGFQAALGSGTPKLVYQRPGDKFAYPVELIVEGPTAIWIIRKVDTENPGIGRCELGYYPDDGVAKTAIYKVEVQESMNAQIGFEPEEVPNWVDEVNAATAKAEAAAKAALEAAEEAKKAAGNTGSTGDGSSDSSSEDNVATDEEADEMLDEIFGDDDVTEEGASSEEA